MALVKCPYKERGFEVVFSPSVKVHLSMQGTVYMKMLSYFI